MSLKGNEDDGIQISFSGRLTIPSIANRPGHWVKRYHLFRTHRLLITSLWRAHEKKKKIDLPCTVTITRASSHALDDDNLIYACKAIRDTVADLVLPGLASGQADGDKRIRWEYTQEKSKVPMVKVEVI